LLKRDRIKDEKRARVFNTVPLEKLIDDDGYVTVNENSDQEEPEEVIQQSRYPKYETVFTDLDAI